MTHMVDRLGELRGHLDHLRELQGEVESVEDLEDHRSLRNDVLFSLLMVTQLLIDVAGELCSRRMLSFESYSDSVRKLSTYEEFPRELLHKLELLPGFRNAVIHDYIDLDYGKVLDALGDLEPLEEFVRIAARLE